MIAWVASGGDPGRLSQVDLSAYPHAFLKKEDLKEGQTIKVVGRLRMVGSGHFSRLVLTPPGNFDIYLDMPKSDLENLKKHQYQFLEVTGIVKIKKMVAPGGKFLHNRYRLKVTEFRVLK